MKTILLLGAIESFCDVVEDLHEAGYKTVVCDYYPDAPAKKISDFFSDDSTTDEEAVYGLAVKYKVDGIMCAFSDRNIPTCHNVAKRLGLRDYYTDELVPLVTNKIAQKKFLQDKGFNTVKSRTLKENFSDNEISDFDFPVVIKPVDASGSKGVIVCYSINEVREHVGETLSEGALDKEHFMIEEFYDTDEISVTGWVKGGICHTTCMYDLRKVPSRKWTPGTEIFPSKYTDGCLEGVSDLMQRLVTAFGVTDGPVTGQLFMGDRGVKVNEFIVRLCGGSPYMYTEYLGGPNLAVMTANLLTGQENDYSFMNTFTSKNRGITVYQCCAYVGERGRIYYGFTEEDVKRVVPECVHFQTYYPSGINVETIPTDGKLIARMFVETDKPDVLTFESVINRLEKVVIIRNENGENIADFHHLDTPVDMNPKIDHYFE